MITKNFIGFIAVGPLIFILTSCNNSGKNMTSEKELELQKKELSQQDSNTQSTNATKTLNQDKNEAFYIINVAAIKTESDAKTKVQELKKKGYKSDYLWIPDYASLSGALFYSVYIGPYSTQYDCEVATEEYRKKHTEAYGLLVSQDNKRVQINGIGKVTISEVPKQESNTKLDVKFKIKYAGMDNNETPSSKIYLSISGKEIYIASIQVAAELIEKSDFPKYDIPKNALSACGGWWAGGGDYFYTVQSKSGLTVYQGWQEDGVPEQADFGFHWKKTKEIAQ
jgi:hypothetical protein